MRPSLFEEIKAVFTQYRKQLFIGFLFVLTSNSLLILNPLLLRQAVMAMDATPPGYLPAWVMILLTVALLSAIFKYYMRVVLVGISREAEMRMRSKIFERIQAQSMAFYDKHGIGELLSRLTNDISLFRDVLGPGVLYPLFFITLMVPGLLALFSISAKLASLALIPIFAIPLFNLFIKRRIYRFSQKVQKWLGDLSDQVQEHYAGIRTFKSYAVEKEMDRRFRKNLRVLVTFQFKLSCAQGLVWPFFTLITKIVTAVLVIFTGLLIFYSWQELSAADFVSFMWIQSYVFVPVLMLGWVLPIYERGRAAYDRLLEIYKEPIEVKDRSKESLEIPEKADLRFSQLSFNYPGSETPVLKDISCNIEGGTFVGITGPIGGGKSTLFRLINREYEIQEGMIIIGGRDIHEYPLESFHKQIVTVEQIPFLFSRTIGENVRFGKEEASQEEIEWVMQWADLEQTVLEFPDKYETMVGERGMTLSGGQKQRLAMARAFLVNRSILLLDDVFAHVDSETESQIFAAMQKNFRGKTVLLITSRVAVLEKMDRILFFQEGTIVEDGSPRELLKRKGSFAALKALQEVPE